MPLTSRFMIAYGILLLAGAVLAWFVLSGGYVVSPLAAGVAMIAAAAAATQGRRSLRRSGLLVGTFLPVLCSALFAWRALELWQGGSRFGASLLGVMSLAGLVTVLTIMKLRVGDSIAERGYSVLPLTSHPQPSNEPTPPEVSQR